MKAVAVSEPGQRPGLFTCATHRSPFAPPLSPTPGRLCHQDARREIWAEAELTSRGACARRSTHRGGRGSVHPRTCPCEARRNRPLMAFMQGVLRMMDLISILLLLVACVALLIFVPR